jgi:hypothetical protein
MNKEQKDKAPVRLVNVNLSDNVSFKANTGEKVITTLNGFKFFFDAHGIAYPVRILLKTQ